MVATTAIVMQAPGGDNPITAGILADGRRTGRGQATSAGRAGPRRGGHGTIGEVTARYSAYSG
ncbi:hypothetical protein Cci01nite_18370 [Catellatospora citrea]|uniref:Uncharacterized protein n=1 Tax=Catellatospora citrea TaxID=53366 RepID=A0A8J3KCW7_9ACTN|nr:hypothetical protein Cci01nite_18370 [Catellatospora citrea]